jgi:DNA polymerase V
MNHVILLSPAYPLLMAQPLQMGDMVLPGGFPWPAADYEAELVNLNQLMLRHSDAPFLTGPMRLKEQ